MADNNSLGLPDQPRLADNITHFARALRKAGVPIGPGRVIDAVRAVQAAGFTERQTSTGHCMPVLSPGPSIGPSLRRSFACSGGIRGIWSI